MYTSLISSRATATLAEQVTERVQDAQTVQDRLAVVMFQASPLDDANLAFVGHLL